MGSRRGCMGSKRGCMGSRRGAWGVGGVHGEGTAASLNVIINFVLHILARHFFPWCNHCMVDPGCTKICAR